jgi:hypothetical protein
MFHAASTSSVLAFVLVCGAVVAAFLRGIWLSARTEGRNPRMRTGWVAAGVVTWLGLSAGLVKSGWVEATPARLIIVGAATMLGSLLVGCSRIGGWLAQSVSLAWLLAFQGFRLPLELVLHAWVRQGVIPETMTWTGSNWDVLSGLAALALAPFCGRSRLAAWTGNGLGLVLLANVGRVAVLSAPVPFGWHHVTPKLLLPYHLPYALIVPVCVGGALIGHVALTRALWRRRRQA